MGCTEAARQEYRESAERERIERKTQEAREAIVERLNERFDLRSGCIFEFRVSGLTLQISSCSPTKARILPEEVLSAEDRKELKSLGLGWVETTNRGGATEMWGFNEDLTLHSISYK
jgi:hypothetical protein